LNERKLAPHYEDKILCHRIHVPHVAYLSYGYRLEISVVIVVPCPLR